MSLFFVSRSMMSQRHLHILVNRVDVFLFGFIGIVMWLLPFMRKLGDRGSQTITNSVTKRDAIEHSKTAVFSELLFW